MNLAERDRQGVGDDDRRATTAVRATGNTREEIWDAMMRRETYATSGARNTVRYYGGYDYTTG